MYISTNEQVATSEHPWDESMTSETKQQRRIRPVTGLIAVLSVLLVSASLIQAQTPLPPDIESTRRPKAPSPALTSDERDLARDYADVLESVQLVVGDFSGYFSQLNIASFETMVQRLQSMGDQITSGKLASNPQMLLDQIRSISTNAEKLETQLGHAAEERKGHKLLRQLTQELDVIADQLDNDIVPRFNRGTRRPTQISDYILDSLEEKLKQAEQQFREAELAAKEAAKAYPKKYPDVKAPKAYTVPPTPPAVVYVVPQTPAPPGTPAYPGGVASSSKQTVAFSSDGMGSVIKQFSDSITVSSPKAPIVITNPAGEIIITGWKRNMVQATAEMHFTVPSRQMADQILANINLKLAQSPTGLQVNFDVPRFSDSRASLNQNRVEVFVPITNPIEVTSQFGMITVSGLSNGISINAANSTVNASGLGGTTTIRNSFGPTNVSDVTGQLEVLSTQGPVGIVNCNAKMHIVNSYAIVQVDNSRGDANIQSAGPVEVRNHKGNVTIINQNGSVDLSNVQGDVSAQNAFGPTTLRAITGTTMVENSYANIILEEISGLLKAQNRFGTITGQTLHGPIAIQSDNGAVNLLLGRDFSGNSTINANYGSVQVIMPQESDVNLLARTTNGDIKTTLPTNMTSTGNEKVAVITVGAANKKLTVDGNGSLILVSSNKR